ncbi:hypothetical protein ABT010_34105 [Streptomyces sp. NPDC002668]|uniref:hypothetical protein n=1 Tax=Streptomyces sp. NPDC002668 TaxID=3154422 RepID=UPI00331E98E1
MSERLQKKSLRAIVASALTLAVGIGGALLLPTAAVADDGDRTQTVSCGTLESTDSSGVVHAKIRNCAVTWGKNILDGSYWQTVKFQLLDSRTDGVCARARVAGEHGSKDFSECNGVWTTKTANLSGRTSGIFISIGYGRNAWDLTHYKSLIAPSGF